ncbi:MAG TPA: hypothetical protein PKO09_01475 [Anaerolineae bacterium]|nr:hypothetical protein [Anaerolineae bacterium]HNS49831.1 hypothetical protein [Anaerolineae bacterium]
MNNDEAQYRFRRTVAEVIKVLTDPDESASQRSVEKLEVAVQNRDEAQDNDR